MKKKTKQKISKVGMLLAALGLCWVLFVDHRPKEYVELVGSFEKYEERERKGRYGNSSRKIYIKEHPLAFHLEKNGTNYGGVSTFLSKLNKGASVKLFVDKEFLTDTIHSFSVYKIIVNDSAIFNRLIEDATIIKKVSLIKD